MIRIKKASGHIEVVLSFVIFISFVIFLFAMFPVYQIKKSEIGLDSAERGILNFTSAKANYFVIVLNKSTQCFSYPSQDISSKLIVRNSSGGRINAKSEGGIWYVQETALLNDKFYGFYYSSEFSEEGYGVISGECKNLTNQSISYEIGLVRRDEVVSYSKMASLINNYNLKYGEIRGNFSMPAGENFEFSVVDLKGNIILNASRKKPERTTVLSRNTPIQMVYNNGTYVFGMLNTRTW